MVERDGPESDGARSYDYAVRIHREQAVRRGDDPPRPDDPQEQKWAREGEVQNKQLDTVKEGRW